MTCVRCHGHLIKHNQLCIEKGKVLILTNFISHMDVDHKFRLYKNIKYVYITSNVGKYN